eukprot:CAMPEP_0170168954 /NCGR_PEP_ID=MMETSP0040_2-20121228/1906_1 /TAXON_ID=641309 /ORGANISM="Lotharella oceanica, Strain CCMP622" /LENGTH=130 /DNA_ID=CAMNT_0010407421 /DNA_START=6 /DNA_END=398 /DNA_ORIENTATION=-
MSKDLPNAKVNKLMKANLGSGVKRVSTDATEATAQCLKEFIQLVAGQAQLQAEAAKKSTIYPEHFVEALAVLGYPSYAAEIKELAGKEAEAKKNKPKRNKKRLEDSKLSMEELKAKQAALFAKARSAMNR